MHLNVLNGTQVLQLIGPIVIILIYYVIMEDYFHLLLLLVTIITEVIQVEVLQCVARDFRKCDRRINK